jgi:hypothetical protein
MFDWIGKFLEKQRRYGSVAARPRKSRSQENLSTTAQGLLWWGGVGLFLLVLTGLAAALGNETAAASGRVGAFLVIFAPAAFLAAAAASVGGLFGFLFGIPRTLQDNEPGAAGHDGVQADRRGQRQAANTNLEQISDWLTKILVGAGLTQIGELPRLFRTVGSQLTVADSVPVTLAIMVTFLIGGFFSGYLLTRLFLAQAFREVDDLVSEHTRKAEVLTVAGAHHKAVEELHKALAGVTPETPTEQKRAICEQLIFNSLYKQPPEGFEEAIRYGEGYVAEEGDASALIWAYLAAAYGQKYKFEKDRKADSGTLEPIRQKALACIQRAIEKDAGAKLLLKSLWDPNGIKNPQDDDLEVFYQDAEFADLLAS